MAEELVLESFAVWLLAAQLLAGTSVGQAIGLLPADTQDKLNHTNVEVVQLTKAQMAYEKRRRDPAQMWVKAGDPKIYVASWTDTYKKAEQGDKKAIMQIAAGLAHELWHQQHGPDEAGAYNEQIKVLKDLGADKKTIEKAENSRDYTLYMQGHIPKPKFMKTSW